MAESGSDYRLAAAGREAEEDARLDLLEQIYDPASRGRRTLVQPGWRCLEVGAGRGSMAVWLAKQVGPTGHVVATDLDTRYLPARVPEPRGRPSQHPRRPAGRPRRRFVRSRLLAPDAVPPPGPSGAGDQADGRVPAPRRLARRRGLRLGDRRPPVDPAHPRYDDYQRVWRDGDWWTVRGYDKTFGRRLPALFERAGLEDIRAESSSEVVRGGSPWPTGGSRPWRSSMSSAVPTRSLGRCRGDDRRARRPDAVGPPRGPACLLGQEARRRAAAVPT